MTDEAILAANPAAEAEQGSETWEGASILERAIGQAGRERATRHAAYPLPTITPLSDFADYREASTKRARLATEAAAVRDDLTATRTAIARGFAALRDDETNRQARDILAGRAEEAFEGFEELRARVARLSQRAIAYGEAVRMQDEIVATIRADRSIDATDAMAGAHKAAVTAIADAIAQLRTAFDLEEAARMAVTGAGYDARLPAFVEYGLYGNSGQLDRIEAQARQYAR